MSRCYSSNLIIFDRKSDNKDIKHDGKNEEDDKKRGVC